MPLVLSRESHPAFVTHLDEEQIPHIDEAMANEQEIYPLNCGLANLMPAPAMTATELQWFRWFGSHALVQIRPHFVKFDHDQREREGASREEILQRYTPLSEIRKRDLHSLVITGDNLETKDLEPGFASGVEPQPMDLEEIGYKQQLKDLIAYSESVPVTIFSCLAAHFALNHIHGLVRENMNETLDKKIIGVFSHDIVDPSSPLMRGMGDRIVSPHSRWGDISVAAVEKVAALKVLAVSKKVGWLALEERLPNGNLRIYLQGHPEYDKNDLDAEYKRDRELGPATMPEGYYPDDDCSKDPICNWPPYARVLHENILGEVYNITERRRREASPLPVRNDW